MKKLVNRPEDFVREMLEGMEKAHGDLIGVNYEPRYIYRKEMPQGKVAVISGGGSGHEPMHGGFVGIGMLDAACPGEVFTSPTPDQMYEAGKKVHAGGGVLFIVKNYSGDVMNFEMATEMLNMEGIPTINVLVDDDVAVKDSLYTQGRRGTGTTVLMEKIVGAAAEWGKYDLKRLADLARKVNVNGRSMGMALTPCTVPTAGKPTFELGEDEMEIGIGIHGEPGRYREPLATADEITERLALAIIEDGPYTRTVKEWDLDAGGWKEFELTDPPFQPGDHVIAMVNSMGGTPVSELYVVYRKLHEICEKKGLTIVRNLIGAYITSLEMQGVMITLLKVDDEILEMWDKPVKTPALRWGM